MRTDRRTDMTKPIVAFRNFAKELKNHTKPVNILRVQKVKFKLKSNENWRHYAEIGSQKNLLFYGN